MDFGITHNASELRAAFNRAPAIVTRRLQDWIDTSSALVERQAKQEVPVVSSRLQNSIFEELKPLWAKVSPNTVYAGWVHDGAKSPFAPLKLRGSSYKGNPFMTRTYASLKPRIERNADKTVDNILKDI